MDIFGVLTLFIPCFLGGYAPFYTTGVIDIKALDMVSFNPRTRMGCDPYVLIKLLYLYLFQSTHPHGVRRRVVV